jgi:hypothetical protein
MTSSLRTGLLGVLVSAGCVVAGCDSGSSEAPAQRPIDSPEATSTINQRVEELVAGLGDTTAQVDTTDSTAVATGAVESATGSSSACPVSNSGSGASTSSSGSGIGDVPQSTTDALNDLLHQVAQEAKEHVFREELVEVSDGNQVVYKVDPVSACGSDSTCFEKLSLNPVRFVVTANADDSLNVALLVGEARLNPGSAVLGPTRLSARIDLAQSMDALRLYMDAEDQQDLPDRLAGVVEGAIV